MQFNPIQSPQVFLTFKENLVSDYHDMMAMKLKHAFKALFGQPGA